MSLISLEKNSGQSNHKYDKKSKCLLYTFIIKNYSTYLFFNFYTVYSMHLSTHLYVEFWDKSHETQF